MALFYYLFAVNFDRCMGYCNTVNNLSNKMCIPNKTEDLNLSVFNIITGRNESKILSKHVSCECKCKFDGIKCNSNQKWNNDKCWNGCKNPEEHNACEKDYIWNHATCSCENGKYLASTIDNSVIMCDKIIKAGKSVSANVLVNITCTVPINASNDTSINFSNKNVGYEMNCCNFHTVFLVLILLFIISFICYRYAKHRSKQKTLTH